MLVRNEVRARILPLRLLDLECDWLRTSASMLVLMVRGWVPLFPETRRLDILDPTVCLGVGALFKAVSAINAPRLGWLLDAAALAVLTILNNSG